MPGKLAFILATFFSVVFIPGFLAAPVSHRRGSSDPSESPQVHDLISDSQAVERNGLSMESAAAAGNDGMSPIHPAANNLTGEVIHLGNNRREEPELVGEFLDLQGSIVLRTCNSSSMIRIKLRASLPSGQVSTGTIDPRTAPSTCQVTLDRPQRVQPLATTSKAGRTATTPSNVPPTLDPRLTSLLNAWRQEEDAGTGDQVN